MFRAQDHTSCENPLTRVTQINCLTGYHTLCENPLTRVIQINCLTGYRTLCENPLTRVTRIKCLHLDLLVPSHHEKLSRPKTRGDIFCHPARCMPEEVLLFVRVSVCMYVHVHLFIWLTDIMRTLCVSVYDRTCVCIVCVYVVRCA